jgi:hypothetical protein
MDVEGNCQQHVVGSKDVAVCRDEARCSWGGMGRACVAHRCVVWRIHQVVVSAGTHPFVTHAAQDRRTKRSNDVRWLLPTPAPYIVTSRIVERYIIYYVCSLQYYGIPVLNNELIFVADVDRTPPCRLSLNIFPLILISILTICFIKKLKL